MLDFLKRKLEVGHTVVHGVGGRYAGLSGPYKIMAFTPKMVKIGRPNAEGVLTHSSTVPSSNLVLVTLEGPNA